MNIIRIFMISIFFLNIFIPFSYAVKMGLSSSNSNITNDNLMKISKCPDFTLEKITELFTGSSEIDHDDIGFEKSIWSLTKEGDYDQWRDVLKEGMTVKKKTDYPYLFGDDLAKKHELIVSAPETKMYCDYTVSVEEKTLEFSVFQELEDVDIDALEMQIVQRIMDETKFQQEEEYERNVRFLAEQLVQRDQREQQIVIKQKSNKGLVKGIFLGGLMGAGLAYFFVKSDSTL